MGGLQLVISAATKSSDVQILRGILERRVPPHVRALLITPLMVTQLTLRIAQSVQDDFGIPVLFDSGGYAVQTGRLDYFEMYSRLLELYQRERWAGFYTLPDHVPTSRDQEDVVEAKVRQTVECSELFFREMPNELRERALGVAHGRTLAQIEFCLVRYERLGLRHVGFGSFTTTGNDGSINIMTRRALANARQLATLASERGMTTHLFGIGVPALLPWIADTGATSFDSGNWARSAGFGQIFLPLTRGYNVSHRNGAGGIQQGLTRDRFEILRSVSDHACAYCQSFEELQTSRAARSGHNLFATTDALDIVNRGDWRLMEAIYHEASPKYRRLWQERVEHA